jgi:O-antigen ligase
LLGIGLLFLINFAVASASRIALVVAPLLILLLGWRLFGWRGALAAILVAAVLGTAMWVASPVLRDRIAGTIIEMQEQRPGINRPPSISEHAAFIKESFSIIASAPIIGHGTGSIAEQFQSIAAGKTGVEATLTVNPHNQTFAVAIQLGLVGAAILWAMWIAHFALFSGRSAFAWLGLIVVAENVLSSTVHSHLFDFNNGWLYVFGVGVLGGSILSERDSVAKKIEYGR